MGISKIYITGVSGFIGRYLADFFRDTGIETIGISRHAGAKVSVPVISYSQFDGLASDGLLKDACVIHCAGRAHVMKEKNGSPEQAYKAANVDLSERLLSAAKSGGASQMIFMSTVKVNGEGGEQTYHAEDQPIPEGHYANSKLMAEQRLLEGSGEELSVSILRLPLVYGPGVKGNLALLDRVIQKGISLPFAGFSNKRDMISLGNLASIVDFFIKQPPEASRVWMVSDNCGLSTAALCQAMARAKGQPLKLFWLPAPLLRLLLKITGKQGMFDRLFGSFKVDIKPLLDAGWKPVQTPEEGFMEMYRGK